MNSYLQIRSSEIPQSARKRVFCGYDASHMMTYGNDTFLEERITLAGGINVAGSLGSSTCDSSSCVPDKVTPPQSEVSLEQVIAWNPDVIIIDTGSPEELYRDSRWASIKAVRDHQVFIQPFGIFKWSRQNAESALFYPLWLAKTLYPDQFADLFLENSIRDFYRDFFHYQLSDYQVNEIMSGSYSQYSRENGDEGNITAISPSGVMS
jgi:iron complex transport system substrate-binding protein